MSGAASATKRRYGGRRFQQAGYGGNDGGTSQGPGGDLSSGVEHSPGHHPSPGGAGVPALGGIGARNTRGERGHNTLNFVGSGGNDAHVEDGCNEQEDVKEKPPKIKRLQACRRAVCWSHRDVASGSSTAAGVDPLPLFPVFDRVHLQAALSNMESGAYACGCCLYPHKSDVDVDGTAGGEASGAAQSSANHGAGAATASSGQGGAAESGFGPATDAAGSTVTSTLPTTQMVAGALQQQGLSALSALGAGARARAPSLHPASLATPTETVSEAPVVIPETTTMLVDDKARYAFYDADIGTYCALTGTDVDQLIGRGLSTVSTFACGPGSATDMAQYLRQYRLNGAAPEGSALAENGCCRVVQQGIGTGATGGTAPAGGPTGPVTGTGAAGLSPRRSFWCGCNWRSWHHWRRNRCRWWRRE